MKCLHSLSFEDMIEANNDIEVESSFAITEFPPGCRMVFESFS
jgi:hypothetical protein